MVVVMVMVMACCGCGDLPELLFALVEEIQAEGEPWFYEALPGGTGAAAVSACDGLFKEFGCQAPGCHGKSAGFRCLKFLPPLFLVSHVLIIIQITFLV